MAITFPASPVNGQTHTENGQIFVFDSTRGYWLLKKQDQIVASTSRSTFVATAGQTVHTVNYDPSASVIVSVNGVMLNPQDITSTNGTSIIFDTALALSDEVDIVFHQPTASNLIRQDISDPMATESYVQTYVTNNSSVGVTTVADMAALIALTGMANGDQALVTANNNLFIYSGSGWYKIATVQNDSPSAITGVSGSYELAIDGTATTITAASTDPEGFPLTWSYSTSGLGSIATVSHVDNVFTITPSTNEADIGTFTLTINATDGVNGAVSTSTNLTLEFIVIVTNSRYTTLLATAVDTSDNNNITDASTSNHTITVNGDAHAGTFSPYRSGGYSTYFDGTGDYLQLSSVLPSGAFTVSCWAYFNTSNADAVWSQGTSGNAGRVSIQMLGSNLFFGIGSTNVQSSAGSIVPKTWYYIEAQYSGSQIELFINGSSVGTASNTTNPQSTNFHVGTLGSSWDSSYELDGYVSDLKVVSGTPSGSSTVPTEPLSSSGSALHICHLPYIADGSTNGHSITVNGNVSTKPFSPYDYTEYSATDHGGSVYHGGTAGYTDYIEGNYTAIGTNDFTLQFWVYPKTSSDIYAGYFSSKKSTTITGFTVAKDTIDFGTNTSSGAAFGNPNIREEAWSHVAVVRSGDNSTAYVNGKSIGTISGTGSYNIASDRFWTMQRYGYNQGGGWPGKGYISDLKISQSVDYTADFTPPTSPLSSSGADIHIKSTDASIIDKSQGDNLKLVGNTTGSTTQVKFSNTKSMYFDGTGDVIQFDTLSLPNDFTIEYWLKLSTYSDDAGIFGDTGATNSQQRINHNGTLGTIMLYDAGYVHQTTNCFTQSEAEDWMHIAYSRQNGSFKLYVNGVQKDSVTSSKVINVNILGAGGYLGGNNHLNGYIQDFRITKGLARYTANFTPPTASLEG